MSSSEPTKHNLEPEALRAATHAVYARTETGQRIQFDLLPRKVQEEIMSIAITAIHTYQEAATGDDE